VRILVTGSTGFIGSRLVHHLLEAGHSVRVTVRPTSDLSRLPVADLEVAHAQLPDDHAIRKAMRGMDGVIHLASLLKVPWKPEFQTVNVGGTACVAQACASMETPPVLVHVSSLAAAGPTVVGVPQVESNDASPVSIYGATKLAAEAAIDAVSDVVPASIVRPPMVLGSGDTASLPLFTSVERGVHVVPTRKPMEVSAIHVEDLCTALLRVLVSGRRRHQGDGSQQSGIYYAAADEIVSYGELGSLVAQAMGKASVRIIRVPAWISYLGAFGSEILSRLTGNSRILTRDKWREATAGSWTCDPARLKTELDWSTDAPLLARLEQTAEGYRSLGLLP
jgi:dihydroflavonol-4-reductase